MTRDPRVQLYDGEIPLRARLRANLTVMAALAVVLRLPWAVAGLVAVVAVVLGRGHEAPASFTAAVTAAALVTLAVALPPLAAAIRTVWTVIKQRTHVLRLALLRDGWRTAAVWVDQPKSGGPWRVETIGAIPLRREIGAALIAEALDYADEHGVVVVARARTEGLAELYERYGFTHDAPGSRHMTRQPKPV